MIDKYTFKKPFRFETGKVVTESVITPMWSEDDVTTAIAYARQKFELIGEDMNCNHCGESGSSVYGQADGSLICEDCLRRAAEKTGDDLEPDTPDLIQEPRQDVQAVVPEEWR